MYYQTSFLLYFKNGCQQTKPKKQPKGFENTFLLPLSQTACGSRKLLCISSTKETMATLQTYRAPDDILIHKRGVSHITPHRYMLQSGNEKRLHRCCYPGRGIYRKEMDIFYQDAQRTCESLFSYEPFRSMKSKFNIVAVASPSTDSGVSVPRENCGKKRRFILISIPFYSGSLSDYQPGKVYPQCIGRHPPTNISLSSLTQMYMAEEEYTILIR